MGAFCWWGSALAARGGLAGHRHHRTAHRLGPQRIAYINWTISLYQVGAIVAGAAPRRPCARAGGIKRVFIGATLIYTGAASWEPPLPAWGSGVRPAHPRHGRGMLLSLSYVAIEAWFAPESGPSVRHRRDHLGRRVAARTLDRRCFFRPAPVARPFWAFTLQAMGAVRARGAVDARDPRAQPHP